MTKVLKIGLSFCFLLFGVFGLRGDENIFQAVAVSAPLTFRSERNALMTLSLSDSPETRTGELRLIFSSPPPIEKITLAVNRKKQKESGSWLTRSVYQLKVSSFKGKGELTFHPRESDWSPDEIITLERIEYLEKGKIFQTQKLKAQWRCAINLGPFKEDRCHTFRIPGLVTTKKGTLIGVWDNRYRSKTDLQGDMDIGMRRSTDGGKTWEPLKVIMDMGTFGGLPQDQNGVSDPCIVTDARSGKIFVAAAWLHGFKGKRSKNVSRPGTGIHESVQMMMVSSDDDGVTWSKPQNITAQVKPEGAWAFQQGPGRGICTKNGVLVIPVHIKLTEKKTLPSVIISEDGGKSWRCGSPAIRGSETQVVETPDGLWMINSRRGSERSSAVSSDMGKTWQKWDFEEPLIEPKRGCQGSIFKWTDGRTLVFSNPSNLASRSDMTLWLSSDNGKRWKKYLTYDEREGYGYSCLSEVKDKTLRFLGILYEQEGNIAFMRVPMLSIKR